VWVWADGRPTERKPWSRRVDGDHKVRVSRYLCPRCGRTWRVIPAGMLPDQGKPFVNHHARIVCADLGIRLLHAKPDHAWSKGKVELRFDPILMDPVEVWPKASFHGLARPADLHLNSQTHKRGHHDER